MDKGTHTLQIDSRCRPRLLPKAPGRSRQRKPGRCGDGVVAWLGTISGPSMQKGLAHAASAARRRSMSCGAAVATPALSSGRQPPPRLAPGAPPRFPTLLRPAPLVYDGTGPLRRWARDPGWEAVLAKEHHNKGSDDAAASLVSIALFKTARAAVIRAAANERQTGRKRAVRVVMETSRGLLLDFSEGITGAQVSPVRKTDNFCEGARGTSNPFNKNGNKLWHSLTAALRLQKKKG